MNDHVTFVLGRGLRCPLLALRWLRLRAVGRCWRDCGCWHTCGALRAQPLECGAAATRVTGSLVRSWAQLCFVRLGC